MLYPHIRANARDTGPILVVESRWNDPYGQYSERAHTNNYDKQMRANNALLRTSHKVRRPENADVGDK